PRERNSLASYLDPLGVISRADVRPVSHVFVDRVLCQVRTFLSPAGEVQGLIEFQCRIGVRVVLLRKRGGGRYLVERRRCAVWLASALWKSRHAAVPITVQLDLAGPSVSIRSDDRDQIPALIAFGVTCVDSRGAMQRLMNVADKVNDKPQRLSASGLARAGLEYVDILLERFDDVIGLWQIGRQLCSIVGERKIDKVKIAGELEAGEAPDVVSPMRRFHKILALLCHARGFNLHRQKRFDLRLGLRIQPLKRDIRYHHVTAGSPSKRWLRAGQQQDCEACDRDYFDAR